uniref:Uncharacterized protein n=1 Tax=Ditylum brightwellii TaxID=49249 RepID=A0A7S4V408_9STRA
MIIFGSPDFHVSPKIFPGVARNSNHRKCLTLTSLQLWQFYSCFAFTVSFHLYLGKPTSRYIIAPYSFVDKEDPFDFANNGDDILFSVESFSRRNPSLFRIVLLILPQSAKI